MTRNIISRMFGGLGNQLFIYAASRDFALRYNSKLYLDIVSGFVEDKEFRREFALGNFTTHFEIASARQRLEPFSKFRRSGARLISQKINQAINGYVYDNSLDFKPELLQLPKRNTVYLEGYWQSPQYFTEENLRNELKIIAPTDQKNQKMVEKIRETPSTSVHMRFFDEDNVERSQLKASYYLKASQLIRQQCASNHFYVFSDDPIRAEREAERIFQNDFTIVNINGSGRNAYADMWLMSSCDNNIIADSTFSWWGAWFNSSPDRIIIAPAQSLSGRYDAWKTESLIPENWILL